eukprot:jgi/Ulvmu1/12490/UM009_0143.1
MPKKNKHQSKQSKNAKCKSTTHESTDHVGSNVQDLAAAQLYVAGLRNASGQSCFANAALQMLASSSQLMCEDVKEVLLNQGGLARDFIQLLHSINSISTQKVSHSAVRLLDHLSQKYSCMDGQSQQDSHEALIFLLEMVHHDVSRGSASDATTLSKTFQADVSSIVTCMTCSSSHESKQAPWVLSVPVSGEAQPSVNARVSKGWSQSQRNPCTGKAATVREGSRQTRKLTAKAQKSRDKGLRKEEKRRRKQQEQRRLSSITCHDAEVSDEDVSDREDEEPSLVGEPDDSALGDQARSGFVLARSTSVKGIDLKRSMLERHGWSAPWLPGLWKLPNGDLFDVAASQTSLLISLQLCFEKETDVPWRCPKAQSTLALRRRDRSLRAPGRVQIAERGKRDTVFEVPGRSHATCRSLPGIEVWSHFFEDSPCLTWEKVWIDPFNLDNRKVIQVAQISEQLWFENQHPSGKDELNDPNSSSHLSRSCRFFELTLNNDLGSQYVETHQLAIPPVEFASEADLATLSQLVAGQHSLKAGEYQTGEKIVEGIIMKAQVLLECAHDALTELGLEGIGSLFGAPIHARLQDTGCAVVEGWLAAHPVDVSVESADTRQLFVQCDRVGDVTWLYPAPDLEAEDTGTGTVSHDGDVEGCSNEYSQHIQVNPTTPLGEAIMASFTDDKQTPVSDPSTSAPPGACMKRVDSWMHDKFTAQPTRSNFPPLSDRNFLLAEEPDGGSPGNIGAGGRAGDLSSSGSPVIAREQAEETRPVDLTHASSVRVSILPIAGTEPIGGDDGVAVTSGVNSHAFVPPDHQRCSSDMAEASLHSHTASITSSQGPLGANTIQQQACAAHSNVIEKARGTCNAGARCDLDDCRACCPGPSDLCRIHPEKRGILVRPDNGLRLSERQVLVGRLPPLLIFHLRRFEQSGSGTRKNSLHVSFPFHMYIHPDVAPRSSSAGAAPHEAIRYRLKAVVEHHGHHVDGGHYTCYAWRPTACACLAAHLLPAMQFSGRSQPVPVPQRGAGTKRKGRKETRRQDVPPCSTLSPKAGMCDGSQQLSHGGSSPRGEILPRMSGASAEAGSVTSAGRGSQKSEPRSAVPGVGRVGADELDWEEIADVPQDLHPDRTQSNNSSNLYLISDNTQDADISAIQKQVESIRVDDVRAKANERLRLIMSSDIEDDVGVWMKCDDECIEEVPWQTVSCAQAYMLMYENAS